MELDVGHSRGPRPQQDDLPAPIVSTRTDPFYLELPPGNANRHLISGTNEPHQRRQRSTPPDKTFQQDHVLVSTTRRRPHVCIKSKTVWSLVTHQRRMVV